jgi:hypothetical protein
MLQPYADERRETADEPSVDGARVPSGAGALLLSVERRISLRGSSRDSAHARRARALRPLEPSEFERRLLRRPVQERSASRPRDHRCRGLERKYSEGPQSKTAGPSRLRVVAGFQLKMDGPALILVFTFMTVSFR